MTTEKMSLEGKLRAEFTVWLDTTLARAKCNYLTKENRDKKETSLDGISVNLIPDPQDCFAAVEHSAVDFEFEEEKLARAFSGLPLMRKEVLRLLFVEEKDPDEIAAILNCSTNYVHLQKFRALKRLRQLLTEGGDDYG